MLSIYISKFEYKKIFPESYRKPSQYSIDLSCFFETKIILWTYGGLL